MPVLYHPPKPRYRISYISKSKIENKFPKTIGFCMFLVGAFSFLGLYWASLVLGRLFKRNNIVPQWNGKYAVYTKVKNYE